MKSGPYLCLFSRANHPRSWTLPHGYVTIIVSCADAKQAEAVVEHVTFKGIRLVDAQRVGAGPPLPRGLSWENLEWYGGPGGAFDHLCTIEGSVDTDRFAGDYRLFVILDAAEVLADPWTE